MVWVFGESGNTISHRKLHWNISRGRPATEWLDDAHELTMMSLNEM